MFFTNITEIPFPIGLIGIIRTTEYLDFAPIFFKRIIKQGGKSIQTLAIKFIFFYLARYKSITSVLDDVLSLVDF